MRKILAIVLAVAMLLGSTGTVFALETNVDKTSYTVVVSEDFENARNVIKTYVDGKELLTSASDYYALESTSIYGMGDYAYASNKGAIETGSVADADKIALAGSGANQYVEIEFDAFISQNVANAAATTAAYLMKLVQTRTSPSDNQLDAGALKLGTDGYFYLEGDNGTGVDASSSSGRKTEKLTVKYNGGETYRIKWVLHLTDENSAPLYEIAGVYINGVNAIADTATVKYLFKFKTNYITGISFVGANQYNRLDNFSIVKYNLTDVQPAPATTNKGKLVSLIREYDTTDTNVSYYGALDDTKEKYEDQDATQTDIDNKAAALETAVAAYEREPKVIVSEDFENEDALINLYCDGTPMVLNGGPEDYKFSLADSGSIFGTGSKMLKSDKGTINTGVVKALSITSSATPNTYVETVIDVITSNSPSRTDFIEFVQGHDNSTRENDIARILADSSSGKFQLVGQNKRDVDMTNETDKARDTVDLTVPYVPGEIYRFKVVMRLTDNSGNPAREISAVYINGVNALTETFYMHHKGNAYGSLRLLDANKHKYDNFAIHQYALAAENDSSPISNKGKLVSVIRKYYTDNEDEAHYGELQEAITTYNNAAATQTDIDNKAAALETAAAVVIKMNDDFEDENNGQVEFESMTGASVTEFDRNEFLGDVPFIDKKALKVTGGLMEAKIASPINTLAKKTKSVIDVDFCLNNVIGTSNDVKMMLRWTGNTTNDTGTKFTQLYFNKNSSGVMQLQCSDGVKNLTSEVKLENDKWYNLKLIINAVKGPSTTNLPLISIYLDGVSIAEEFNTQSYNTDKFLYCDLLEIDTKAESGILLDNLQIYELNDDESAPITYGTAKRYAWDAYAALNIAMAENNSGNGELQYDPASIGPFQTAYEAAIGDFKNATTQEQLNTAADDFKREHLDKFKPNGKTVGLGAVEVLAQDETTMTIRATVETNNFASATDNVAYVVAVPMESDGNGGFTAKTPEMIKVTVSGQGEDNYGDMVVNLTDGGYVSVFAISPDKDNPKLYCNQAVDVWKDNIEGEITPDNYNWNKEDIDGLEISRECSGEGDELHLMVRTTADKKEEPVVVLVYSDAPAVIAEGEQQINPDTLVFANIKMPDSQGRCEFEVATESMGIYTLYTNTGYETELAYANAGDTETMLADVKNGTKTFAECRAFFGVDKAEFETASSNGMDIDDVTEKLFETTYSRTNLHELTAGANRVFENLNNIAAALNVDTINSSIGNLSAYLDNYSLFSGLSDGKKIDAGEHILTNKSGITGLATLDTAILNAKNAVGTTTTPPPPPGGLGGGGNSKITETEKEVPPIQEPTPAEERVKSFSDVNTEHWAYEAVSVFAAMDYVSGDGNGTFAPDRAITREEFVKIAVEVFGLKMTSDNSGFADVDKNAWYNGYVCAAVENGVINGYDAKTFGIGDRLSREDLAVIVYRLAQSQEIAMTEGGVYIEFDDEELIADYALTAVKELSSSAIINGVGENRFAPEETCTRAAAIKMLYELWRLK